MNRIKIQRKNYYLFLILELILYVLFLYLDFYRPKAAMLSNILKFTSIILCFIFALVTIYPIFKKHSYNIFLAASALTVLADLFLLFTLNYSLGVVLFCSVQVLYHFYLFTSKDMLLFFSIPSIGTIFFLIYCNFTQYLTEHLHENILLIVPACFYIFMLILNLISSFFSPNTSEKDKLFLSFGFLLLLLCDLQVGYRNIYELLNVSENILWNKLYEIACMGIWIFYLPSQVLLITSLNSNIIRKSLIK
jgi:hypothetical protein